MCVGVGVGSLFPAASSSSPPGSLLLLHVPSIIAEFLVSSVGFAKADV